ncbi:MAG TPA: hypothetical protein PKZ53_28085 [Acidobacteriota bacterium]|nr:hypothetical protein [Acidobacteriota bacterium]
MCIKSGNDFRVTAVHSNRCSTLRATLLEAQRHVNIGNSPLGDLFRILDWPDALQTLSGLTQVSISAVAVLYQTSFAPNSYGFPHQFPVLSDGSTLSSQL